ncbi:MAG TPA: TonB-dependent receptor [Desulfobacteraceae bacterium]|nr:TonB-dependent receptor [Deltaproteobacteria bacterium]HDZ24439.1 TonB-dependent receptor [Desulfobacteraceae bacterium]
MRRESIIAMVLLALLFVVPSMVAAQESEFTEVPETTKQSDSKEKKGKEEKTEEVVVTATRIETASSEVGSSITVITNQQIEQRQNTTVPEILRTVPALDVVRSGGPGGQTSVFIRGAKSEHTLVLIDGIEMNDPITPGRSYDFANLTTDNIERIEIIRGPQSTLYGSDAIGGVINIITKRGKGKPSGFVSAEGGSFNTFTEKAGVSGGNKWANYSLGISRWDTDGISAANEKDGNHEKDGYENTSISTRLGVTPAENLDADFILRYINAKADIDNSGGVGGDDPNNKADLEQLFFRTQVRLFLFNDLWEQKLGFSLTDLDRDYRNDTDADHPSDLDRSSYDGKILKFDWQHNLYLHETNTLTLGIENEEEKGKSKYYSESAWGPYTSSFKEKTARTTGYYLQDQVKLRDSWFTTLGVRLDDHSRFGSETTYRIASAYLVRQTGTKFKGTYGTGFKAPSLYQLYSQYGNQNLDPEESTGWDIGVEQSLFDKKLILGVTYFSNEFDELIEFVGYESGTSKYINVAEAEAKGVEVFASVRPIGDLIFRASYTYTDTEDKETGKDLLRRAQNKFGLDVNYQFMDKGNVNLSLVYVGKRDDNDYSTWPATRVELDDYVLANLAASYDITRNIQVFGRVENFLDEDYEEVKGFGTPELSAFAGCKLLF